MLVTLRARQDGLGSLNRPAIPRGAPSCRRVHCASAREVAAPASSSLQRPGRFAPPEAVPLAEPAVPTGRPKGSDKAEWFVKHVQEPVDRAVAGQQADTAQLLELLEGQATVAHGLASTEAAWREDLHRKQGVLVEAAAGLQKAAIDVQMQQGVQKAAAQARERAAQLEVKLAAARRDVAAARGGDLGVLRKLEAEVEALRGELAAQRDCQVQAAVAEQESLDRLWKKELRVARTKIKLGDGRDRLEAEAEALKSKLAEAAPTESAPKDQQGQAGQDAAAVRGAECRVASARLAAEVEGAHAALAKARAELSDAYSVVKQLEVDHTDAVNKKNSLARLVAERPPEVALKAELSTARLEVLRTGPRLQAVREEAVRRDKRVKQLEADLAALQGRLAEQQQLYAAAEAGEGKGELEEIVIATAGKDEDEDGGAGAEASSGGATVRGADVNALYPDGERLLVLASGTGRLDIVQALLGAGAEVDAANGEGETALHRAALENRPLVAQCLLIAGANARAADVESQKIPNLGSGFQHVVRLCPPQKDSRPLHHAAANNNTLIIDLLLKYGGEGGIGGAK
ncbi:26S proteasome non-ATPase regulatory subunit 10 [Tetrabaena socialis]|uniref:26S proteasome non-ATPase regulatory subunit 10 n=1 Tax=Tetrabaena socialis TaxID=47790 RepID=A0A2J8A4Z4_9CHLO|nr:26S proteasome non-ATPase regulatory subunit 10 [Tetrabaena socialis]|eukprot:PNH07575.1 26S proteasome non-ATPase regulatory subunit 10 [Tetrabaena socialis]